MKKLVLGCVLACLALAVVVAGGGLMYYALARNVTVGGLFGLLKQGIPSRSGLAGSYRLVSESGGQKPGPDAIILLRFLPSGTVTLRATRPGESLTDVGTYREQDGQLTVELPALGRKAERQPFELTGSTLILPIQIIGEGTGTSSWQRVDPEPDALREAIGGFYANVQAQGRGAALQELMGRLKKDPSVQDARICNENVVLITYRGGYQEFFLAPERSRRSSQGSLPSAPLGFASARGWASPSPGPLPLAMAQFMPMQGLGGAPLQGLGAGIDSEQTWLAHEPEPVSQGDAPPLRSALILAAFHTLPILIPEGNSLNYFTFKDKGENLGVLVEALQHANYDVPEPILDRKVTVKLLYEQLSGKSPGVFYFSTHGAVLDDDGVLSTGEQVPMEFSVTPATRERFLEDYFKNYLEKQVGGTMTAAQWARIRDQVMIGFLYDDIPFVCVKSGFFPAIGADFSHSLVYLSGCETSKEPHFRKAMKARAFLGWGHEVEMELGADMSQAFFRCLSRRTRSDREAWDFGVKYCWGKKEYKQKWAQWGKSPTLDPHNFRLYRQGKTTPEKELSFHACHLLKVVRGWVCQRKGGQGLEDTVKALYTCDKTEVGLDASAFCMQAFNGVDIPDDELDIVKGESCGYMGGEPRFTLEEQ